MTDSTRRRTNPLDIRPGTAAAEGPRPPQRGDLPPADPENRRSPAAPGAARSPQMPGQVPDRSTVPGHGRLPVAKATASAIPLTEFGTAQRIMQVFALPAGQEDNPARWEQATAAYEEIRKADISLLPPMRPGPGFNLVEGEVDLAMLPDGEGIAPALPPDAPAAGAAPPAPGDAVGTGGTMPATAATAATAVDAPMDVVPGDRAPIAAADAPAPDRPATTEPSAPETAAEAELSDRVIDHTSMPPDAGAPAMAEPSGGVEAGAAAEVVAAPADSPGTGAATADAAIAQPTGGDAPTAVYPETGGESETDRTGVGGPPTGEVPGAVDTALDPAGDESSRPGEPSPAPAEPAAADVAAGPVAPPRPLDPRLARLPQTGWVPGDGSRTCPADYPVKGNATSRIFHRPSQPSYRNTIPEVCFASDEAAKAAGFRPVRSRG